MFKCQVTDKYSRRGDPRIGEFYVMSEGKSEDSIRDSEKLHKIIIKTRERIYMKKVKNEETNKWEEVEAGRGWEIVREIDASEEGLALWHSWGDDERASFVKGL